MKLRHVHVKEVIPLEIRSIRTRKVKGKEHLARRERAYWLPLSQYAKPLSQRITEEARNSIRRE